MVFGSRRKRLRVSQPSSDEESPEEVGEFDPNESSDSDFETTVPNTAPQHLLPSASVIEIETRESARDAESWVERYDNVSVQTGPATSSKKTKEITAWMSHALNGNQSKLLVLAGPPGCGKTSAIRMAAKELQCRVSEWIAPATGRTNISMTLLEHFHSFFVGGRYSGLQVQDESEQPDTDAELRKILLVRDLPLIATDILQKRIMLQNIFSEAAKFAPYPTVVVISDSEKGIARAARMLLGSVLLESPYASSIKVSAITDAMMRRRLREVLSLERLSISQRKLDELVASANGDIRAALNGLQFCAITGKKWRRPSEATRNSWPQRENSKRRRYEPTRKFSFLTAVGQDNTLGTYHAIAKILNNKRDEYGSSAYTAEDVLEDARADPASFLSFLHHNYPNFFTGLDDAVSALHCLSDSDCLLTWRQDDLARTGLGDCAASVVTRGFLHYNSTPIRSGWRPIRGPESFAVAKDGKEHVEEARRLFSGLIAPCIFTRSTMCETVPFLEQITQSTIKQWGQCGTTPDQGSSRRVAIADAAEVSMINIEDDHTHGARSNIQNIPNEPEFSLDQDCDDDIEEWND